MFFLNSQNVAAWRQNNGAVYDVKRQIYRKNPFHKKGIPDVIGFHKKTGQFVAVEVKAKGDKLSINQERFLEDLKQAGGIALVATPDLKLFENQYKNQIS